MKNLKLQTDSLSRFWRLSQSWVRIKLYQSQLVLSGMTPTSKTLEIKTFATGTFNNINYTGFIFEIESLQLSKPQHALRNAVGAPKNESKTLWFCVTYSKCDEGLSTGVELSKFETAFLCTCMKNLQNFSIEMLDSRAQNWSSLLLVLVRLHVEIASNIFLSFTIDSTTHAPIFLSITWRCMQYKLLNKKLSLNFVAPCDSW